MKAIFKVNVEYYWEITTKNKINPNDIVSQGFQLRFLLKNLTHWNLTKSCCIILSLFLAICLWCTKKYGIFLLVVEITQYIGVYHTRRLRFYACMHFSNFPCFEFEKKKSTHHITLITIDISGFFFGKHIWTFVNWFLYGKYHNNCVFLFFFIWSGTSPTKKVRIGRRSEQ